MYGQKYPHVPAQPHERRAHVVEGNCGLHESSRPGEPVVSTGVRLVAWRVSCSPVRCRAVQVGRLLVNVCRQVPGGVVAFAQSFAYLEELWARWVGTSEEEEEEGEG